jgi:TolB protein
MRRIKLPESNSRTINAIYRPAKRLTFLQRHSHSPRFSPEGSKIIFTAYGLGRSDVYRINVDGSEIEPLTNGEACCDNPVFSPNGKQIAYIARAASYPAIPAIRDIHIMNADGSESRALTASHKDCYPRFSPDGQAITFISQRDGRSEIYRMRADGTDQQRLTCIEANPEQRDCPRAWN